MSRDLRTLLRNAAPLPAQDLELAVVAQRARRGRSRAVLFVAASATVSVASIWIALTFAADSYNTIAPVEGKRPPRHDIAPGPRHVLGSGTFDDRFGSHSGKEWALTTWGDDRTHCWAFQVEDEIGTNAGVSCSSGPPKPHHNGLGSRMVDPGDENVWGVAVGQILPDVAAVEIRLPDGDVIEADQFESPDLEAIPYDYFLAFVPGVDQAQLVVLDHEGNEVSSVPLCHDSCTADRGRHPPSVEPMPDDRSLQPEERVAIFGIRAVASAGLLDPLGDLWAYGEVKLITTDYAGNPVWGIRFSAAECFRTTQLETCRRRGKAELHVVRRAGKLSVRRIHGPADRQHERSLLAYTEPWEQPHPYRWEFPNIRIDRELKGSAWGVRVSPLWTGPMPPPVRPYGSVCRLQVRDEAGNILWETPDSRPIVFDVREEEFRGGGGFYVEGIRLDEDPAEADFECTEPGRIIGWR